MQRPKIKDKDVLLYVESLEERLKIFEQSPYVDGYLTLLNTIKNWNKQIKDSNIDLFAHKDNKDFDRVHKFLIEQQPYYEQLKWLRKEMTPEQQAELKEREKIESLSVAETLALKTNGVKKD